MMKSAWVVLVLGGITTWPAHAQTSATRSIRVDAVDREWRMHVPPSYRPGTPTPLVIDLHGSGGSPEGEAGLSDFESLADEEGFLVATPAGMYLRPDAEVVSWNVYLDENGVDDVAFIRELIGHLGSEFSIDPRRIYAAGMSGGARMSSRLGCDLSDIVAAVAPVAGIQYPVNCEPGRPVPVVTFHGRMDGVNHYEHRPDSPPYWDSGVEEAVSRWVRHNACVSSPGEERVTEQVVRLTYSGCSAGADVVFYRSEDGGHTWPGSPAADRMQGRGLGVTNGDVPATRLIWAFFQAHPLPASGQPSSRDR